MSPSPLQPVANAKIDAINDELFQYAIKDFLSFLDQLINVIFNGKSFASVVNLLNNYISGIGSVSGEENVAPYKAIMARLQNYAEVLLTIGSADKSKMIRATFKRLLEEQIKLHKEV